MSVGRAGRGSGGARQPAGPLLVMVVTPFRASLAPALASRQKFRAPRRICG